MLRVPYIKTAKDQSASPARHPPLARQARFAPAERRRAPFALRAKDGGGERDRTDGLLVANQALSQLSYTPERQPTSPRPGGRSTPARPNRVVGLGRLELPTSRLSGVRSSQLSYRPPSL